MNVETLERILGEFCPEQIEKERGTLSDLLPDLGALGFSKDESLRNLLQDHWLDAVLVDQDEVRKAAIAAKDRRLIERAKEKYIVRLVRKCFELRFGLKWDLLRAQKTLHNPVVRAISRLSPLLQPVQFEPKTCAPAKLFIYMSEINARKVLDNSRLLASSPLRFNDILDMRLLPSVQFDAAELATAISQRRTQFVFGDRDAAGDGSVAFKLLSMVRAIRAPKTTRESFAARNHDDDLRSARALLHRTGLLKDYWRHFARYYRVVCFCEAPHLTRMWNEYGDRHRGVVLEFSNSYGDTSLLRFARAIRYAEEPQVLGSAEEWADDALGLQPLNKKERLGALCFIKHPDYINEKEWRAVYLRRDWASDLLNDQPVDNLTDLIPFDSSELTGIYFGMQFPASEKSGLAAAASKRYPHVRCFEARGVPNQARVEFDELPIADQRAPLKAAS